MKKTLLAGLLLAGSTLFAAPHFSVGIGIGVPVAPPAVVAPAPVYDPAYIPPSPGPDYAWTAGYYGPTGVWIPGFWNYGPRVVVRGGEGFRGDVHRDFARHDVVRHDVDRGHRR
jgi:hypothetical protein